MDLWKATGLDWGAEFSPDCGVKPDISPLQQCRARGNGGILPLQYATQYINVLIHYLIE
jgi:hypothetical protein